LSPAFEITYRAMAAKMTKPTTIFHMGAVSWIAGWMDVFKKKASCRLA
jgi:hypothetical protein